MDAPHADQGRSVDIAGCDLAPRQEREARLSEELQQAEDALAALRVQYVDATLQLQREIVQVGDAVHAHQRHVEDLEGRLADITASAEAADVAHRRTEGELVRMRATLTWRLRGRLLRFGPIRLALRWIRRSAEF